MTVLKIQEQDYNKILEKVRRYEEALLSIVENPKDWETSYDKAYTESVKIALKALNLDINQD
jgi:hypothetical protein